MSYYERKLPHWQPESAALFLTWRLHGSLPAALRPECPHLEAGEAFVAADRHLDRARRGPLWLTEQPIAELVAEAFEFGERVLRLYDLHAYVVMANHVHVLLTPLAPMARITRALKWFTARKANQLLGRTGKRFWEEESYDHWVRNQDEFQRIVRYIELNPVSAGLAERIEDWPWSSASRLRDRQGCLSPLKDRQGCLSPQGSQG